MPERLSELTPEELPRPRFCQVCGGRLDERALPGQDRSRYVCCDCGFIHYLNPRVVAATVPSRGGRLLLVRRAMNPMRGYWTFPGGFLEVGETTQQGALRETEEEIGLQVELGPLLGVYTRSEVGIVVVVYLAEAGGGEPVPEEAEILEIGWYRPDEIPWDDLAFETTRAALRDLVTLLGNAP